MNYVVLGAFDTYVLVEARFLNGGLGELFMIRDRPDLLYKRFNRPLGSAHVQRIVDLVDVGRQVSAQNNLHRIRRIAWPIDFEIDLGEVLGVVIPRAGEEYFRPSSTVPIPQNFSHLASSSDPLRVEQRLIIVRQLAGALNLLDKHDLVHGDVSGSNIMWTVEPKSSLLLVDCDGIHPRDFQMDRAGTRYWKDPRLENETIPCHDSQSDWYALALAIYRTAVLGFRETPTSADFAWIEAELPRPIAEPVVQVFSDPLDTSARVSPKDWQFALRQVIEDETQCLQIEEVNQRRPATVAGRRAANRRPRRVRRSRVAQAPGVSSRSAGRAASVSPQRSVYLAGSKRSANNAVGSPKAARRLLVGTVLFLVAVFVCYRFTGSPNWPILNMLNNLLLNTSQRKLVAELPSTIYHCSGDQSKLPKGTVAAVACDWKGREIVAIKFSNTGALDAFYKKRAAVARQAMAKRRLPYSCPAPGMWHKGPDNHTLGYVASFTSAKGARIDWSRSLSLIYFVGLGSSGDLDSLCVWWGELGL